MLELKEVKENLGVIERYLVKFKEAKSEEVPEKLKNYIDRQQTRMSNEFLKVFQDNSSDIKNQIVKEIKKELGVEFSESLRKGKAFFQEANIHNLGSAGKAKLIVDNIDWSEVQGSFQEIFERDFRDLYEKAGEVEAGALKSNFNLLNPRAVEYLREYSAEQVVEITESTKNGLKEVLGNYYEQEKTVGEVGRELRKHVGLHSKWAGAVENRKQKLIGAGIPQPTAENRAARYAQKLKRKRCDMIARTETIAASNHGRQEAWKQAGYKNEKKVWITTPDDRLCEDCVEMDGQEVGIEDNFNSPEYGSIEHPPLHPHCRCAMSIKFVEVEEEEVEIKEPGDFETPEEAEKWLKEKYDIDGELDYDISKQDYPAILEDMGYTFEEINEFERNNFEGFREMSLDMDLMNDSLKQFDKLAQQYPDVADRLEYIGTYGKGTYPGRPDYRWDSSTFAHASKDGKRIGLNPDYYYDYDRLAMAIENSEGTGWHPKGITDPVSVLTHEYGHQVHNYYKNAGWGKFKGKYVHNKTSEVYGTSAGTFSKKVTRHNYSTNANNELSEYATKNKREAFAEGFTVINHNPDFEHPYVENQKEFLNLMEEEDFYDRESVIDVSSDKFYDEHGFEGQWDELSKLEKWFLEFTGGEPVYG